MYVRRQTTFSLNSAVKLAVSGDVNLDFGKVGDITGNNVCVCALWQYEAFSEKAISLCVQKKYTLFASF